MVDIWIIDICAGGVVVICYCMLLLLYLLPEYPHRRTEDEEVNKE